MPFELKGPEKRELRHALVKAFPGWNDLRRMVSDQLDLNLATVTAQGSPLEDNAFDLIVWAASRGVLGELLLAARNQNPNNPDLQDLATRLGLSSLTGVARPVLEKIVSSNVTLLDVARWRAELTRAEWRVCRVDRDHDGVGSGFLIGKDLVLTNYHVVRSLLSNPAEAPRWSCRFDHKLSENGDVISMGRVVKLAPEWKVDAAPPSDVDEMPDPKPRDPADDELDFALLRLAEPVGEQPVGKKPDAEQRGWIPLPSPPIDFASTHVIAILQHPSKLPMKLALGMQEAPTLAGGGKRLRYKVPTESGSSGSPVFDGDWQLLALHHSVDPKEDAPAYNEAIPITLIADRPLVAAALTR